MGKTANSNIGIKFLMLAPAHKHNTQSGLVLNVTLRTDPTRTTLIRRAYERDAVRRFKEVRRAIVESIVKNDCFGLKEPGPSTLAAAVPKEAFKFDTLDNKIDGFMDWLESTDDRVIHGTRMQVIRGGTRRPGAAIDRRWTDTYVRRSYEKGVSSANTKLNQAMRQEIPALPIGSAAMNTTLGQGIHADRLAALYTRNFRALKGITAEMEKQISAVLTDGLVAGINPRALARTLTDRVDKIGITRARTLARTEVIRAHHIATVTQYRAWGVDNVKVKAEWATAGFNVCPICEEIEAEGKVYTIDEIEGLIPRHPNCRCTTLPVLPT